MIILYIIYNNIKYLNIAAALGQINILQQANMKARQRQKPKRSYTRQQNPMFIQKSNEETDLLRKDREDILRNVEQCDFDGFGLSSFFTYRKNKFIPIFSSQQKDLSLAGRIGKGKLFLFGHPGPYETRFMRSGSNIQLIQNILKWMNQDKPTLTLGLLHELGWPKQLSFSKTSRKIQTKLVTKEQDLKNIDILCVTYYWQYPKTMTPKFNEEIRSFVQKGGNLIFFSHGWVWQTYGQYKKNKSLIFQKNFANYVLLKQFQVYLRPDLKGFDKFIVSNNQKVKGFLRNELLLILRNQSIKSFTIPDIEFRAMLNAIERTQPYEFQSICPIQLYHELVDAFINSGFNIDSNYNKLQPSNEFVVNIFNLMNAISYAVPPHICRALPPSLNNYPGFAKNRLRMRMVMVPRDRNQRIFTGLYLNPGEVIKITHKNSFKDLEGVKLKVNLNNDLSRTNNGRLKRFTRISKQIRIKQNQFTFASPHGGIIYFQVSKKVNSQPLNFNFYGAYEAPYWNQNIHSFKDFERIKKIEAPIFIIQTKSINLIGPTKNMLSQLDLDIKKLSKYWNTVMGHYKEYRGGERYPFKKQSILNDVNTVAGYMHAGNPINSFDDVTFLMLGVGGKIFQQGNWAFYHQMGHNHQDRKWTIGQMTEVTCNIYSLYLMNKMHGITIEKYMYEVRKVKQPVENYFNLNERNLETYSKDPFVALVLFSNIMEQFGFEVFSKVHKQYDNITLQKDTVEAKVDKLVQQVSLVTGHNMHYYFKRWGLPVTDASLTKISSLPEYKCKRFPIITKRV